MPDKHTQFIVGSALAVGTLTAASLAYLYMRKSDDKIPTKWKKTGEIIDLNCFPVKSCAPVRRNSLECHILGFQHEAIFDRCFVVSHNNKQVTALTYPKMMLIQPKVCDSQLILSAPRKSDFVLDLNELKKRSVDEEVQLWAIKAVGVDAGDEVANWISEYLVDKPGVFRLFFYPYAYPTKVIPKCDYKYSYKVGDVGAYHDSISYMLINQASIDELNTHLDHVVKPLQFRPNIVIEGPEAYEEDNWKWIRLGKDAIFRGSRPCIRCGIVNINPETAERNPQHEPLKTLKKNRTLTPNEAPVMGLYLAIRKPGTISIGDAVYVSDESEA